MWLGMRKMYRGGRQARMEVQQSLAPDCSYLAINSRIPLGVWHRHVPYLRADAAFSSRVSGTRQSMPRRHTDTSRNCSYASL